MFSCVETNLQPDCHHDLLRARTRIHRRRSLSTMNEDNMRNGWNVWGPPNHPGRSETGTGERVVESGSCARYNTDDRGSDITVRHRLGKLGADLNAEAVPCCEGRGRSQRYLASLWKTF
jgi:hypothetical protein